MSLFCSTVGRSPAILLCGGGSKPKQISTETTHLNNEKTCYKGNCWVNSPHTLTTEALNQLYFVLCDLGKYKSKWLAGLVACNL